MRGSQPSTGVSFPGAPGLLLVIRFTCLLAGAGLMGCHPVSAQATTPGVTQPFGMGATSPFTLGPGSTVPPVGIPLGSTEIATPGLSPAAPLAGAGSTFGNSACSGSTNSAQSSGEPFDGGGLSGSASVSCAPTGDFNGSGPNLSGSSVGRAGIPLGSTELGGAGLSSAAPVPAPPVSPIVSSPSNAANADEWQYYLKGKARMTVFDTGPNTLTMDFNAGDIGYVRRNLGHYVENVGDTDLQFIGVFRAPRYEEVSLSNWLTHTPPALVAQHLNVAVAAIAKWPDNGPGIMAKS